MAATKKFYIKERENPQTGIYYTAKGQLTKKEARDVEETVYGSNTMLEYETESEYNQAIKKLKSEGHRIRQ